VFTVVGFEIVFHKIIEEKTGKKFVSKLVIPFFKLNEIKQELFGYGNRPD
jgi:hypothetical protein